MKVRLNEDQEIVRTIREGLRRTGGYCPCRLARTEENRCMCREFKDQMPPTTRATATAACIIRRSDGYAYKKAELRSAFCLICPLSAPAGARWPSAPCRPAA